MSEAARTPGRRRFWCALALLLLGFVGAVVAPLLAGAAFLPPAETLIYRVTYLNPDAVKPYYLYGVRGDEDVCVEVADATRRMPVSGERAGTRAAAEQPTVRFDGRGDGKSVRLELVDRTGGIIGPSAGTFFARVGSPRWTRAVDLVVHETGWAAAAAALLLVPLLFLWWRRAAASFVRFAGIACSAAAGASVGALVRWRPDGSPPVHGGTWWTVPVGAALMAAAFLVAPTPRRRDDA